MQPLHTETGAPFGPARCRTGRGRAHGADGFVWASGKGGGAGKSSSGGGGSKGPSLSFWPLPLELASGETVTLELRGDPAGVVSDLRVGTAQLSLAALVQQHPQLLGGDSVAVHVPLQPATSFGASLSSASAAAAAAAAEARGGSSGEGDSDAEEEDGSGSGAAAAAASTAAAGPAQPALETGATSGSSQQLPQPASGGGAVGRALASAALAVSGAAVRAVNFVAIPTAALFRGEAAAELDSAVSAASQFAAEAGGHPTLSLTVQLEPVSCLDAAIAAGLTPAAAQTCLAMLAEPGGLVSCGRSLALLAGVG